MKENKTITICGRKGVGDEVLELPLEITYGHTSQVLGNERT